MKVKGLFVLGAILVIILAGVFIYFQKSNEMPSVKEWTINMNYPVANAGVSTLVALPIECYNKGIRNNSNINKTYISNSADYILLVYVNSTNIEENKRTFIFEIVNFQKGKFDYVNKTLKITNPYNPGIEDASPFEKFREDKYYRVYIRNAGNQSEFVCGMEGIEELLIW